MEGQLSRTRKAQLAFLVAVFLVAARASGTGLDAFISAFWVAVAAAFAWGIIEGLMVASRPPHATERSESLWVAALVAGLAVVAVLTAAVTKDVVSAVAFSVVLVPLATTFGRCAFVSQAPHESVP